MEPDDIRTKNGIADYRIFCNDNWTDATDAPYMPSNALLSGWERLRLGNSPKYENYIGILSQDGLRTITRSGKYDRTHLL